jgi:hypothetical protein
VTLERFGGADSAFELLADSIGIAQDARDRDATTDALRADAVRALLASFQRVYTGRKLYEVMDLDHALRDAVRDDIGPAVERGLAAARTGTLGFDMPTQVASLIGTLAAVDDAHAAKAAKTLLADHPGLVRTLNEIAYALRHGTGATTLDVLDQLAKSPHASVRQQANESLSRRRPS